jgi:hypothetical protein
MECILTATVLVVFITDLLLVFGLFAGYTFVENARRRHGADPLPGQRLYALGFARLCPLRHMVFYKRRLSTALVRTAVSVSSTVNMLKAILEREGMSRHSLSAVRRSSV